MSETQLELQVVSNSKDAADALDELEKALGRVQSAISDGLKDYEEFNQQMQEFSKGLNEAISDETVEKFQSLANSLTTLQFVSRMSFDSSGIASFAQEINSIASGLNELDLVNVALKTVGPAIGQTLGNVLGHFFSSGAETIETAWNITMTVNNESVADKADGWMIDDLLVPALGDSLAGDLKSQIMADGSGSVEVPVTFTINAVSKILTDENLTPTITNSAQQTVSDRHVEEINEAVEETTRGYRDIIAEGVIKDINSIESSLFGLTAGNRLAVYNDVKTLGSTYGIGDDAINEAYENVVTLIEQARSGLISIQDYNDALADLVNDIKESGAEQSVEEILQNIESMQVGSPDISGFLSGMDQLVYSASNAVASIRASLRSLNNVSVSFSSGLLGGFTSIRMAASGGQFDSGEMFIARENGIPEMVGQIGNKTTVANNDQIVEGISSGVASGQAEQNALLRRQNDILMQMLNKKFTAEVVPSAALGKTVRRSAEMYERNAGV